MSPLAEQIKQIAENFSSQETETSKRYLERLKESDRLTRDDANPSHFCVYFLPFNPKTKQVFIIHHKKSGLWLSPGGHIDKNESILDALSREIKEELGLINFFSILPKPFLITITPISNPIQPCSEHLDIWFLLETDGNNFNVDPQEFHNFKWVTLNEAEQIITDKANIKAINFLNSH